MTAIVGNVEPLDEFTHPVGPEPNFNESVYFNFYDRQQRVGGFLRMGNRPNEGRGEMTVCLFTLSDGRLLFRFERPEVRDNQRFQGGGMRVEVVQPLEHLVTAFEGTVYALASPQLLLDPKRAFSDSPQVPLSLHLHHWAAGPLYGHKEGAARPPGDTAPPQLYERDPQMGAASHFEQHTRVEGTLVVAGVERPIAGLGLRDHSWGPRTWQQIPPYLWFTCDFQPGFGLTGLVVWDAASGRPLRAGGMVCRQQTVEAVVQAQVEPSYADPERFFLAGYRARLLLASGERLELQAQALAVAPLRNRRDGRVTYLGEALTEFRYGGLTGFGLTEYLRQGP
jgi:hypothetical protein